MAKFILISSGVIKSLGNVRNRPFSEIWMDEKNELLMKLKDKKKYVRGRCASAVGWMSAAVISAPGRNRQDDPPDLGEHDSRLSI